ncbi:MAG: hypothetical protein ACLQAT_14625 [Candidatus Binataceae bacterium]
MQKDFLLDDFDDEKLKREPWLCQGEGIMAAAFLPVFMLPWAAVAARTGLRLLGEWSEILSPARVISN